jgi:hypothetical protein
MNNFFWICGQKGNNVPENNDYIYRYKGTNEKIYWKCSNAKCNAGVTTYNGELIKTNGIHMYTADINAVLKSQMKNIIIARLTDSPFLTTNELYDAYKYSDSILTHIVSFYRSKHRYIGGKQLLCHLLVF